MLSLNMREYEKDLYDATRNQVVPTVFERGASISYDIFSRFLKERVVLFQGGFDDNRAVLIGMQLMYLDTQNREKEITLIIQSPGGSVYSCMFICGIISQLSSPIKTVVYGFAASCGLVLFLMGDKRVVNTKARLMGHQVSLGGKGTLSDLQINIRDGEYLYNHICILASAKAMINHNGQNKKYFPTAQHVIDVWSRGDCYMSAFDAMVSGIATEIMQPTKKDPFYKDFMEFMKKNRSKAMLEHEKNLFGAPLTMPETQTNLQNQ
jgi:ATP-dependent Clp protease protease subunit